MKLLIIYSYDGSFFHGSQRQPDKFCVENALENAFNRVGMFGEIHTSSRTDKGVHALNQCSTISCKNFHFNDVNHLKSLLNRHLHPAIHIKKITFKDDKFQVRFDAIARSYRYLINHNEFSPFLAKYFIFLPRFEIKKLNEILQIFVGEHDFINYMKNGSKIESSVRNIIFARAYESKNLTIITFKANGFLRAQVRLMIANAIKMYQNSQIIQNKFKLESLTRMPFSPNGLYLNKIFY